MIARLPPFLRIYLWGPVSVLLTVAPLLVTQVLQCLSVVLLPFSKRVFRRANTLIAGAIWGYWAWALRRFYQTELVRTGDPLPYAEDALVLCNHQQMGDIVVVMALAQEHGRTGHLKWLVKDVIKYIPGVGWGMLFLDCVFLKRDWSRDEGTLRRVFERIADNRLPVWLTSFPEGTRATPGKIAEGRSKAIARGIEPFQHLLTPKSSGFAASIRALRHHVTAVYAVTINYPADNPTLLGLIRGDYRSIDIDVRRFPVAALPDDPEDLSAWLLEDFRARDRWLSDVRARRAGRSRAAG